MTTNTINVPHFRLLLNGKEPGPDLITVMEAISFEEEINLPSMFTVQFNTVAFQTGDWRGIDLKTFKPGDPVQVFMGMDRAMPLMAGEIASLQLVFGEYHYLEIRGYDRLHRLQFGTWQRSFNNMKDSEIASSIAAEAGMNPRVEDTTILLPYLFQNNCSNYSFLLERARRIGYEMAADDRDFIFRKSREDKPAELTLEYGVNLQRFSVELQALTPGNSISVSGWNVRDKKAISATAGNGSETSRMGGGESGSLISQKAFGESVVLIPGDMVADSENAEQIAKATFNRLLQDFICGEGTCAGNPELRAGKTVAIQGIGPKFSGIYYLVSTIHSISREQGYTTTFKVKRTGI